MKAFCFILIFSISFLSVESSYGGNDKSRLVQRHALQRIEYDSRNDYLKLESSGCTTRIRLDTNSSDFFIEHDVRCDVSHENRESTIEIATSINDIIKYFNLEDEIKSRNYVLFNIGWKIDHETLIQFINYDESWPKNIHAFIKEKYKNENDRYIALKEKIRHMIVKSKIYDPFVDVFEAMGCSMTLSKYFVEGLFFDHHKITKEMLIEQGIFKETEAKKDEYPVLKGPITFELKCKDHLGRQ